MAAKAERKAKATNKCDRPRCKDDAASPRAVASAEVELPHAPKDGEYHRMENSNSKQRFKNKMKLQVLDSIAIFEIPIGKRRKGPRTVTLRKETEHSCIIEWPEVNSEWPSARLQYHVCDDVEGMLEGGKHFWKLFKAYSESEVADLFWQQELASPLPQLADAEPQLADAVDASAAASASPVEAETHSSEEETVLTSKSLAQRRVGAREWLDGPGA